MTEEKSQRLKM